MYVLRVNMTSLRRDPNSNRTTANIPVDSRKAFSREAVPHVSTNVLGDLHGRHRRCDRTFHTHPNKPSQFITQ